MKKIAVTGANGFIASAVRLYNQDRYEFLPVTRKQIDFTDPKTVYPALREMDFDVLIHTAANAKTEFCAEYPELSHAVNVVSAEEAARAAKDAGAKFVFISTEQVFNGRSDSGPFTEEDEPLCVTNYGNQKLEAEKYIQNELEDYLILRLSSMFSLPMPGVKPSANFMVRTWDALRTETPAKFTPHEQRGMTYVMTLAEHLSELLALPSGIFHYSSVNNLTTYELCRYVAEEMGYPDTMIDQYILKDEERYADRFRDYRLSNEKLRSYGIDPGTMEQDVARCLKDFGWK